jgi:hypothetical protein
MRRRMSVIENGRLVLQYVRFEDGWDCGRTKSGREERHIHFVTPLLNSFRHVCRYDEMRSYSEKLKRRIYLQFNGGEKKNMTHVVNHINGRTERETAWEYNILVMFI